MLGCLEGAGAHGPPNGSVVIAFLKAKQQQPGQQDGNWADSRAKELLALPGARGAGARGEQCCAARASGRRLTG